MMYECAGYIFTKPLKIFGISAFDDIDPSSFLNKKNTFEIVNGAKYFEKYFWNFFLYHSLPCYFGSATRSTYRF